MDLYLAEIHFLANNKKTDVILCVLDESLTKIIYGTKTIEIDDDFNEEDLLIHYQEKTAMRA